MTFHWEQSCAYIAVQRPQELVLELHVTIDRTATSYRTPQNCNSMRGVRWRWLQDLIGKLIRIGRRHHAVISDSLVIFGIKSHDLRTGLLVIMHIKKQ
jgi:hypothetical protein